MIGSFYYEGIGGNPKDYIKAAKWFREAAEQGEAVAQTNMGVMYVNGEGLLKDAVIAYAWLNIAAANGQTEAANMREVLSGRLSSEQIAEAQKLSRMMVEANPKLIGE